VGLLLTPSVAQIVDALSFWQCNGFCCLHFVVEDDALSATLHFERSLDLEVITLRQGRSLLSINNYAAASAEACQKERHLFAAAA
jgi:hypothetical protein